MLDLRGTFPDKGLLADLTPLQRMSPATLMDPILASTKVSDVGMACFKDCKNLSYLNLFHTKVDDTGLVHFKDCKNLCLPFLNQTKVCDAGLANFKDCKNRKVLHVDRTQVGDAGLAHVKGIPLRELAIYHTGITDLTPLQGMPLEYIRLTPKNITRGMDILRDMKRLNAIGVDQTKPRRRPSSGSAMTREIK